MAAARAVGGIAEEMEAEQRMVVEDPVRGSDYGFAVSAGVPGESEARLTVVLVGLNTFLQSEGLVGWKRQSYRGLELGREFHVVAHAVVQREIVTNPPGVLPEQSQRFVGE